MSWLRFCFALAACYLSLCAANPTANVQTLERDLTSLNGPSTRGRWTDTHDIHTDFDQVFPATGHTVAYTLEITNTTCNPDGSGSRICSLVNGQFPGPTIRAKWGDTLAITVKNSMQDNGTSIHFHGVRQYDSAGSDGVNGITQCAIAPGDSATYRFQATQHGTGWYHSHTDMQYGDGVSGLIVFEGPASADYDVDLGGYLFNEVFGTTTAWQAGVNSRKAIQSRQGPPRGTSLLINGTSTNSAGGGTSNKVNIERGKRYRLRLINASVNTYIRVSLDDHPLTVITSDFVPIQPYTTNFLLMGIGQRYDVIIEANQTAGAYWFRADVPALCFSGTIRNGSAIWDYGEPSQTSVPTSSPWPNETNDCVEPVVTPLWKQTVPTASFSDTIDVNLTNTVAMPNGNSMVVWVMNEPIWTNYSDPVIGYVMRGDTHLPKLFNTVDASKEGAWNYWLIVNDPTAFPIPHPIHLHGHDFFVIGSDVGPYNEATAKLNWANPTRRDTASLPASGWLALAWRSNNPGTWLMHCHIAFHISEGFGIDYLEAVDQMKLSDEAQYQKTCQNWQKYQTADLYHYQLDDSGL
ncbi:MAG: hypothetical protein M1828_005942 [Chrysothrix sp. TS-e1954]|nr:MAG: hypothetical protein M1828_005942 [Chrysothrix sp. TS-e1954]